MARPKGYDRHAVLVTARDVFWERGYEATSITDLEQSTGLNRSSLYQEFGSKHDLFRAALDCYAEQVTAKLLASLREDDATLDAIVDFFRGLAAAFRASQTESGRGCFMVNATAELAARDESIRPAAAAYRDRLRETFGVALRRAAGRGEIDAASVSTRARILASTLMGIWLTVRIDASDAGVLCEAVVDEVDSWREC